MNETLSRTILTSGTVFVVVVALFFLGGDIIHDFAFALLVGVLVGTYSSIYVASPIVLTWEERSKKKNDRCRIGILLDHHHPPLAPKGGFHLPAANNLIGRQRGALDDILSWFQLKSVPGVGNLLFKD